MTEQKNSNKDEASASVVLEHIVMQDNSILETIEKLANTCTMTRAQINYAEFLAKKIEAMVKSEMYSIYDIIHVVSHVLKAIVAEGYIEGRSATFREFENIFMNHKLKSEGYGMGTIEDINEFLNGVA